MTELPAIVQSAIQAALQAQLNLDLESLRAWRNQLGWTLALAGLGFVLHRWGKPRSARLADWSKTAMGILRPVVCLVLLETGWNWAAVAVQRRSFDARLRLGTAAVTALLEHSPDVSGWTAAGTARVVLVLRPPTPNAPPLRCSFSKETWAAVSKTLASRGVKVPAVSAAFRAWRRLRW